MFTIQQIKDAHAKVKSGADFPGYVQELIGLGVKRYSTFVIDGHTVYSGKDEFQIASEPKYMRIEIAGKSDTARFNQYLQLHIQGQTDYITFCKNAAAAGVEKWTVDMGTMTCTYYSKTGEVMLTEKVPVPQNQ